MNFRRPPLFKFKQKKIDKPINFVYNFDMMKRKNILIMKPIILSAIILMSLLFISSCGVTEPKTDETESVLISKEQEETEIVSDSDGESGETTAGTKNIDDIGIENILKIDINNVSGNVYTYIRDAEIIGNITEQISLCDLYNEIDDWRGIYGAEYVVIITDKDYNEYTYAFTGELMIANNLAGYKLFPADYRRVCEFLDTVIDDCWKKEDAAYFTDLFGDDIHHYYQLSIGFDGGAVNSDYYQDQKIFSVIEKIEIKYTENFYHQSESYMSVNFLYDLIRTSMGKPLFWCGVSVWDNKYIRTMGGNCYEIVGDVNFEDVIKAITGIS